MTRVAEKRVSFTKDEYLHGAKVIGLLAVWRFVKETQDMVGYTPSQLKEMRAMMRGLGVLLTEEGWTLRTPQEMEVVEDLGLLAD